MIFVYISMWAGLTVNLPLNFINYLCAKFYYTLEKAKQALPNLEGLVLKS
jgi:hypothetical protein